MNVEAPFVEQTEIKFDCQAFAQREWDQKYVIVKSKIDIE